MDRVMVVGLLLAGTAAGFSWHFGASLPIGIAFGFLAASIMNITLAASNLGRSARPPATPPGNRLSFFGFFRWLFK